MQPGTARAAISADCARPAASIGRVRGGVLAAGAATVLIAGAPAPAGAQAPSPPVFTVATNQGPVTASEDDLAHWLHVARRTVPGRPTFQDLQLEAMDTLLNGAYLRAEAQEQGITVTDREVSRALNRQRPQLFPHIAQYRRYLVQTGQTRADLLERSRQDLLATKLKARAATPAVDAVTPQIVARYVDQHPRFIPERRDALMIFTAHRDDARAAYRQLAGGAPFDQVARRFSLDEVSKARGGFQSKLRRSNVEPRLAKKLFAAHRLRLEGPVHTKFGYYVFAVTRIYPRRPVTRARQIDTATAKLKSEAQDRALAAFATSFESKWSARTTCAPRFTFDPRCANRA